MHHSFGSKAEAPLSSHQKYRAKKIKSSLMQPAEQVRSAVSPNPDYGEAYLRTVEDDRAAAPLAPAAQDVLPATKSWFGNGDLRRQIEELRWKREQLAKRSP